MSHFPQQEGGKGPERQRPNGGVSRCPQYPDTRRFPLHPSTANPGLDHHVQILPHPPNRNVKETSTGTYHPSPPERNPVRTGKRGKRQEMDHMSQSATPAPRRGYMHERYISERCLPGGGEEVVDKRFPPSSPWNEHRENGKDGEAMKFFPVLPFRHRFSGGILEFHQNSRVRTGWDSGGGRMPGKKVSPGRRWSSGRGFSQIAGCGGRPPARERRSPAFMRWGSKIPPDFQHPRNVQKIYAPGRTRTSDLRLRKPPLYPAELRGRATSLV